MALDEDGFLLAAFRKVKKIGKGLRSNGTSNSRIFAKKLIHETWERLKESRSCEDFLSTYQCQARGGRGRATHGNLTVTHIPRVEIFT